MIEKKRKHTGKCIDCSSVLELVEFDARKSTRILRCQECGLLHHYKKTSLAIGNFLGLQNSEITCLSSLNLNQVRVPSRKRVKL